MAFSSNSYCVLLYSIVVYVSYHSTVDTHSIDRFDRPSSSCDELLLSRGIRVFACRTSRTISAIDLAGVLKSESWY